MASGYGWTARPRDYVMEKREILCESIPTVEHPLRGTIVTTLSGKGTKGTKSEKKSQESSQMTDPLSMLAAESFEGTDPLSMLARGEDPLQSKEDKSATRKQTDKDKEESEKSFGDADGYLDETFEPWSSKRTGILAKYTTSEKLSITTSFLTGSDKEKIVVRQQATTADKLKTRLEQLDDFEEGSMKEMLNLSQQDYVNRIDDLNQALMSAWDADQRVKSLKIAIQCSKLLGDVSVMQFYPSKFVLITDMLDNFGKLVFERIRNKSVTYVTGSNTPKPLPVNFTAEEVPDSAKETCRNWFYKVASIRELIPRLYVEMAILKCYNFLTTGEYSEALHRLRQQIRGIGDPLVAAYARTYLCRVGIQVAPQVKTHLNPCLFDFLSTYKQVMSDTVQNNLAKQSLDMSTYLQLYPPALDWILQCIAYKASEVTLTEILEKCKSCNSALVLNSVMSAFDPKYLAGRAAEFNALIKDCENLGFPKYLLYRSLGVSLTIADPPEDERLAILNEVWKVVMKLKVPSEYIACAEVWIEYPLKHFTGREVNALLGDIIKHMTPDRAFEDHYPQLLTILSKILSNMQDFSALFSMEKFLPFLDMFQKDHIKVDACKTIMEAFSRNQTEQTTDPVIINALMQICKTMHDSVNSLSLEDDIRIIGHLISSFLSTVNFGRDFEQQLNFYVDARANFSNLDTVLVMLVQSVNLLAMQTREIVKGNHTRKTAGFVRACMAYCFITIPSMMEIFTRLKLYLLCGQVALANQAVGQADSFFRTAVSLLGEVPRQIEVEHKVKSSESYFVEFINNLLSTLLIVPDHPDHGTLYLVRGLLNVLQEYNWDENSDAKARVYLNSIALLSASCQERFAYQVHKVDSNDKLYGADKKFIEEILKIVDTLTKEVLEAVKTFGEKWSALTFASRTIKNGTLVSESKFLKSPKKQAFLCLAFINRILVHADLNNENTMELAQKLWNLAQKQGQVDKKLMGRMLNFIKRKGTKDKKFLELAEGMPLR